MNSKTYVALYDEHWPKTDRPTFQAILSFLEAVPVAGIIKGGDQFDFECISHHTKGKGLYRLPGAYRREIESYDQEILTPLEERLPRGALKRWHIGNHERFEADLIEEQPELQGTVDHVRLLRLKERGWEVVPLGHSSKIGKLHIIHGETLTGIGNQAGLYPARKAVDLYGANVLAGHTHSPQVYTRVAPVEKIQKHQGTIAPILGRVNPTYLRNRPTAWLNGFVVIEVFNDGIFNVIPLIVTDGKFAYGGKVYGAGTSGRRRS